MNKLPPSFVWWHWQIELCVWKGDLSLMGNEFKVMEMNVLFEVQRALAEVILSPSDKWSQWCHMVPSLLLDSSKGECDVSLVRAMPLLTLRHCYCDSGTFVRSGHPSLRSVWSASVIACAAHKAFPDRQRIDFWGHTLLKQQLQWVCCFDVIPSQLLPELRTPAGYQWSDTWIFNQLSLCWTFVFLWQTQFSRCAQTHTCSTAPSGSSE